MSCEVASASPFGDPNDWQKVESPNGCLDAIATFNASYSANEGDTVDRQLFSDRSANNECHHNDYAMSSNSLEQTLSSELCPFGEYPADFGQAPSSPYFQSVEQNPAPIYHPSPLRNNAFRRSVSEPPGGSEVQPPPPMMFHREHHYLGKPMPGQGVQLKSLPKAKQQRSHPYQRARRINAPEPPYHPEHRRAHTQPSRGGPTSSPIMMQMPPQYMPRVPTMQEPQYVSSRVCTPIPEAVMTPHIDPALSGPATPAYMSSNARNTLSIPLTVDELRSMIFEVVQKAVADKEEKKDSVAGVSPRNLAASVESVVDKDAEVGKGEET
ncbi:hypothetical protein DOTSEDRAFT_41711 [Dothistroma septosporum NZE10]|uniref:Uncharacterized protein n=1 Tax=Dothistroma septosporum (strain NZE10 / CBS 128990) TaxID=675120 RepID=N1PYH0_DOTSN|nr:hypothetical protein DOTSEDRAFT_41711 [Dothistroma septosporum NZE10]